MSQESIGLLKKSYPHRPEHKILARIIGEWTFESDWYFEPPNCVTLKGRMVNRGILGGHFVESRIYYDDCEISRITYGFDPALNHYTAFGITPGSARAEMEVGQYDESADALQFSCREFAGKDNKPILAERTISLLSNDALSMSISFPERDAGKRLGVELRLSRLK